MSIFSRDFKLAQGIDVFTPPTNESTFQRGPKLEEVGGKLFSPLLTHNESSSMTYRDSASYVILKL